MAIVIDDPSIQSKLINASHTEELCDRSGQLIGHFVPIVDKSKYQDVEPHISDEELDRREREGGGRSLAEILTELEKHA
jgi:hypothetical protein